VPTVSSFYGIKVTINVRDHQPPHFHVRYAGTNASIAIETLETIAGDIPRRVRTLVVEWALAHRTELRVAWRRANDGQTPGTIDPLD
jgi:hypothetical protein